MKNVFQIYYTLLLTVSVVYVMVKKPIYRGYSFQSGNSAVGLAYKSGGLGVPGSNPGCPKILLTKNV